jgi:L-arabinose transport system substrate-binding protein
VTTGRTKKFVGVTACIATAVVLAGCSSGQASSASGGSSGGGTKSGKITIAYLQKQGDQQYFVDEIDGAKAEAAKLGNVTITSADLGTDSNKAISAMNTEVAQNVDGIAIVVPDQTIGPQVIDLAGGIPLVASDDPIKNGAGKAAPFVGFDSIQMGTSVGQKAGELFKAAGWSPSDTKIMTAYSQGLSNCQQREEGEEKGFSSAAGASLDIVKLGTDNSVVDAQNKAGAAITANPGVKHWVVWGCNDESETGVVTALQNGGVSPDSIIGVGLGAYLTCKDWGSGQTTGNKAALFIDGHAVGAASVDALVAKIRKGTPLPPTTVAKTTMVDASNYKQAGVKCS